MKKNPFLIPKIDVFPDTQVQSPVFFRWLDSHPALALALISLAGILVTLGSLRGHTIMTKLLPADPWTIAAHVYQGKGYTACATDYFPGCADPNRPTAMREPVPVLMFASVMLLYPEPISGVLLEIALYIATVFLLYAAARGGGRAFALLAAALWAFSVPVVQQIGDATGDLEAAFWLTIGILFFQRARRLGRLTDGLLAGLFFGLAVLSRSVLLLAMIALVIGLVVERRSGSPRGGFAQAGMIALALALTLSPWVIRNQMVFGAPILGSSLTGYNLYRQNYVLGDSGASAHYVASNEAKGAVEGLTRDPALTGRENEYQMQAFYTSKAVEIISQHPLEYVGLVLFRFFVLWFNSTVKVGYGGHPDWLDAFMVVQQIFMLAAALVGAWFNRRRLWPFIVGVALTCGAYMLVTAQVRYVVEMMPMIAILAAGGIFHRSLARRGTAWGKTRLRIYAPTG